MHVLLHCTVAFLTPCLSGLPIIRGLIVTTTPGECACAPKSPSSPELLERECQNYHQKEDEQGEELEQEDEEREEEEEQQHQHWWSSCSV